jgi:hypothetical protein
MDTEQTNKGIGGGEKKGARECNNNNSINEGKGTKGIVVVAETDPTEEGKGHGIFLTECGACA